VGGEETKSEVCNGSCLYCENLCFFAGMQQPPMLSGANRRPACKLVNE
jgi:hypothetical protein